MRNIIIIISFCFGMLNGQTDSTLNLFRTVSISKGQKIKLRAPVESLKDVTYKDNSESYHLKKGSYSIADSLWIEVNNVNQIIAIKFQYDYDTAYIHELHKYQRILENKGKEYHYISEAKTVKINVWLDNFTQFELIEITEKNKRFIYSVIFDKEKYYYKLKSCLKTEKPENPLELYKIIGVK